MPTDEPEPEWITRGRTIAELIRELQSFEDRDLPVRLSIDGGAATYVVSLVVRDGGSCVLLSYGARAPGTTEAPRAGESRADGGGARRRARARPRG